MKLSNILTIAIATAALAFSAVVVAAPRTSKDGKAAKATKITATSKHVKVVAKPLKANVKIVSIKSADGKKVITMKKTSPKHVKKTAAKKPVVKAATKAPLAKPVKK